MTETSTGHANNSSIEIEEEASALLKGLSKTDKMRLVSRAIQAAGGAPCVITISHVARALADEAADRSADGASAMNTPSASSRPAQPLSVPGRFLGAGVTAVLGCAVTLGALALPSVVHDDPIRVLITLAMVGAALALFGAIGIAYSRRSHGSLFRLGGWRDLGPLLAAATEQWPAAKIASATGGDRLGAHGRGQQEASSPRAATVGPRTSGLGDQGGGPGTLSSGLSAFEAQAVKLPAGPAPDPYVAVAYALGWAVGDALTCAMYQVFDHLPEVPEFDTPADQWHLLVNQISSRCGQLDDHLRSTHADFDLSAELQNCAASRLEFSSGDVKAAVGAKSASTMKLNTGILTVLWSVASPLGKSYQLGRDMQQMCATPVADPGTTVSTSVKTHDAELHQLLITLASKFPANAAHATDNSLRLWSASLSAGREESPADLLRQGRRWHDLLAADVSGRDGLRLTDYVAAADSVAGKLWQTAGQVAARFKVWLIVIVLVAALGVWLIFIGSKGTIGAGITAVLATFGLTWKGIGEFFGRAAAAAEEQLWNAEIDWAIAYRLTILRHPPADKQLKSRSKALTIDQPTKEHLRRYKQWKTNWPDVMTS